MNPINETAIGIGHLVLPVAAIWPGMQAVDMLGRAIGWYVSFIQL